MGIVRRAVERIDDPETGARVGMALPFFGQDRRAREILQRAREQALERGRSDYGKEQDEMASELFLSKRKR